MWTMDWNEQLPPNIVREGAGIPVPNASIGFKLSGILGEVVYEMALHYPRWHIVPSKFRSYSDGNGNQYGYASEFKVFNDNTSKEFLGEIGFEYGHVKDERISMSNKRIRKHMERTTCLRTSKVKVAMSHIKKWFVLPSLLEKFEDSKERITRDMYSIHREFMSNHTHHYRELSEKIHVYVMDNLETIVGEYNRRYTPLITPQVVDVAKILNDYQHAVISNSVTNAQHTKKLTVVVMDDKYVLQRGDQPLVVKFHDELPTGIKTGMGMLKLLDHRQFIKDVGYRLDQNTFVILYDGELDRSDDAELQTETDRAA